MNLEWIDDLIAVIDTGSLSNAAQRRFITQPAFSRRIRVIEKNMGITLIDRARKPVQAQPSLIALEPRLREASQLLHDLKRDLSNADSKRGELILAGQHAINSTLAPLLVTALGMDGEIRIRLRSANREDCLSLLLTRQVDIALLYQLQHEPSSTREAFVETHVLGKELLIPVVSTEQRSILKREMNGGTMRIIAYPRDVFLGDVLHRKLLPLLDKSIEIKLITETALTSATMQLVLAGNGVAWLPLSLAKNAIHRGELTRLDTSLPVETMSIVALRLAQQDKATIETGWNCIIGRDWHNQETIDNVTAPKN